VKPGKHARSAALPLALTLGLVAAVGLAAPATAHVTVNPREATKGAFVKLAFRVPNEESNASTTKLEVAFPDDAVVPSVTIRPTPGWRFTIERRALTTPVTDDDGKQITEAVARITWDGGVIAPEEFQEFELSLGPLPDTDRMVFKALQTYSNGDVVRWIDLPTPGGKDPDHPAPVLTLTAAQPDATTTSSTGAPAAAAAPAASAGDGGTGLESWAGPALAGGGIVLALLLLARRRRPAAT